MGRAFENALLNLGLKKQYDDGVNKLGFNLEDLIDQERDAGLGNGGLGRLAACYLDSSSSMELPLWGYGLRYQYGIFQQLIGPDGRGVISQYVRINMSSRSSTVNWKLPIRGCKTITLGSCPELM